MHKLTARKGGGGENRSRQWERARGHTRTRTCMHTQTHRNTLLQEPISEIYKKGLGSDWVDSWAVITYESNSPQIRTVSCLMATLLPSPSLCQCQPMSQVLKSSAVQVGNTKISQTSDLLLFLAPWESCQAENVKWFNGTVGIGSAAVMDAYFSCPIKVMSTQKNTEAMNI